MADNDDQLNLEHRLDQIENNAEGDHRAIQALSADIEKLRKELYLVRDGLTAHRKATGEIMTLLMWFTEQVRAYTENAVGTAQQRTQAVEVNKKAREILEDLKKRLGQ